MLQISDISKSYGTLRVLTDVSLTIDDGEFVSIVGPSGAGKTTLLNIIGTLERPDSGVISFGGVDVVGMADRDLARFRNRNLGFVFQFHQLLPEFTLAENVALPAMIAGRSRRDAMAGAEELLGSLGLSDRLTHRPGEVSGGERQRAAVARALINDPAVILADEPSGSLDTRNREELYRLFFDLRTRTQKTFIIVTHDESLASTSDRVVHLRDGRITS